MLLPKYIITQSNHNEFQMKVKNDTESTQT